MFYLYNGCHCPVHYMCHTEHFLNIGHKVTICSLGSEVAPQVPSGRITVMADHNYELSHVKKQIINNTRHLLVINDWLVDQCLSICRLKNIMTQLWKLKNRSIFFILSHCLSISFRGIMYQITELYFPPSSLQPINPSLPSTHKFFALSKIKYLNFHSLL